MFNTVNKRLNKALKEMLNLLLTQNGLSGEELKFATEDLFEGKFKQTKGYQEMMSYSNHDKEKLIAKIESRIKKEKNNIKPASTKKTSYEGIIKKIEVIEIK